MRLEGARRSWVAIALLAGVAALAWGTMEPGRTREIVCVLLAGFGLRIVLLGVRRT